MNQKQINTDKYDLIKELQFDRYFKGKTWADYNLSFFENLAHKYDATNLLHSFGTKSIMDKKAIKRLPIKPRSLILDVCTGSGDIAIKIARKYSDANVVGVDASEKMLTIAKNRSRGLANVSFKREDALALSFPDNTFDGVVISFGLRNLSNLERGLLEMKRVVKDDGFICNIDQSKPQNLLAKFIYKIYFCNIAPLLGKIIFHRGEFNSFRYLAESNKYFPDQDQLSLMMESLGFLDIKKHNYFFGAVGQQVARIAK